MATSMEGETEDCSSDLDEDYYTFLNIRREATNEEINNAYRRLSRLYHPDKHADPLQKKQAEILFSKTKKAYEILTDAHKRAIYDNLGTKGLETEGWEVVQRTKTPQEIREEYERLAREREERQLQQRTNPKGTITTNINASELFETYDKLDKYETRSLPAFEVSGVNIAQSIDAPMTVNDTVCLSGQVTSHNGTGNGMINCSIRRILSPKGWAEVEVGAGNGLVCGIKGFRNITRRCFANLSGTFQFTPLGIRPGFQLVLGHQLDKHVTGYLTWKTGMQSSMTTTVLWDTNRHNLAYSIQFGVPNTFVMMTYTRKFSDELKLKGVVKAGTFGSIIEYGCEKKVSRHSVVGASMSLGLPSGITLKIRINRGNQSYIFPIFLSEQLLPTPIIYGSVTPLIFWFVTQKLLINPYLEKQKQREREKHKEACASRMAEKKREAEAAVSLMQETVSRIRDQEEGKKGLVVTLALYGKIPKDRRRDDERMESIDVTIPLQCLVKDSKLILYESSKAQLPGFYDPCIGDDKSLFVQYRFHNLIHEVTVTDIEPLRIPKQSHRIECTAGIQKQCSETV